MERLTANLYNLYQLVFYTFTSGLFQISLNYSKKVSGQFIKGDK